jgi:NAD(P)-dependent dehydrogenase (short-subunit alcohol dehydrogenase family)
MKIFITGGSRGIGHAIVKMALTKGHDVAFTYNNPHTDLDRLLSEAASIAPERMCKAYQLNISSSDQVVAVVDQVLNDFDSIDTVINNAGINKNNLAFSMSDEEWKEVIDTNLSGTFYVIRQFLQEFLANRKGRFVTISSIAKEGLSGQANYSASKAGLIGLSGTIAKEYGSKNITSNVVVPGMFETDMTKDTLSPELQKFWLEYCPLKRMGQLDELAEVVLFLASDSSSFINGQVINVTGGMDWSK